MGRTDAWALNVPEAPPIMPRDETVAEAPVAQQRQPVEDVFHDSKPQQVAASSCPSCSAKLSGVEQKFERCLSCGKSFAQSASISSIGGLNL
jgi:hypothetical protein